MNSEKIKVLIGDNCEVKFEYVDEIKRSPSGKFVYTICQIK